MARNTVHGLFGAMSEIQVQDGTDWLPLDNAQSLTFSSNAGTEYTTVNLKGSYARAAEELPESASVVVSPFNPHLPVYADVLARSGAKLFRAFYGVPEEIIVTDAAARMGIAATNGTLSLTGTGIGSDIGEVFGPSGPVGTTAVLVTASNNYVVTKIGGGADPVVSVYDLSTGKVPTQVVAPIAYKIYNPAYRRQFRASVVTKSNESLTAEAVVENTIDLRLTSPLVKGALVTSFTGSGYLFSGT